MMTEPQGAFGALHPQVRHHVVNTLGFGSLLPIQEQAIPPILAGENVLLVAPTAGGKTEAAFLPLASLIETEDRQPVSVVYVAPTRALLDDLEPRVQRIVGAFGRRAARWHGDTGDAARRNELRDPADVLLTTPESLEVMLVSARWSSEVLFGRVRAVVIDEVHAFASSERGAQLMAVLERVRPFCRSDLQRIGLSATIGDPEAVLAWMCGSSRRRARVVRPASHPTSTGPTVYLDYVGSLENATQVIEASYAGPKRIVFVESRSQAEELGGLLRRAEANAHVLHGSLSRDERAFAIERLRDDARCVVVATSALELGVDIPDVDHVFQIGCPSTVSSFLQRLGRSGRRTGRSALTFLALSHRQSSALLQAAGLIRLWRKSMVERAAPPFDVSPVLAQQVLTLALQEKGIPRLDLWSWIDGATPFRDLSRDEREQLLAHMLEAELLITEGPRLLPGPAAERRYGAKHWLELYGTFESSPLVEVLHGVTSVGYLDLGFLLARQGEEVVFALAGRSWRLVSVDFRRRRADVVPAEEVGASSWAGSAADLGHAVAQSMRSVLLDDAIDAGWTQRAAERLQRMRRDHAFVRELHDGLRQAGVGTEWWTFAGHKANVLLARLLGATLPGSAAAEGLRITLPASLADARAAIAQLRDSGVPAETLPSLVPLQDAAELSKFEPCLPEELRRRYLARRLFDLEGARQALGVSVQGAEAGRPAVPVPAAASAAPTHEPAWLAIARQVFARTHTSGQRARDVLVDALAQRPEVVTRIPAVERLPEVSEPVLRDRVRRSAGGTDLFRVAAPTEPLDAALLPIDPHARQWTVFLREGLRPEDEVRLFAHATFHRWVGHLRDGDRYGHWDRLTDLDVPQRRWDREVAGLLQAAAGEPEPSSPVPPPPGGIPSDRVPVVAQFVADVPRLGPPVPFAPDLLPFTPWPHQLRVAQTIVDRFPERFLLADEVGLGKSIEVGLTLRELIHRGMARRCLLLVPASVLPQWQEELREKFNLHAVNPVEREGRVGPENPWDAAEPLLIASTHLVRRKARQDQLLAARPWDLVVVDEAHHARRSSEDTPNLLLRLLRRLSWRTRGLLVLSATPMQVRLEEAFDLLDLLGIPGAFADEGAFVRYFQTLSQPLDAERLAAIQPVLKSFVATSPDARELEAEFEASWRRATGRAPRIAVTKLVRGEGRAAEVDRLEPAERETLRRALLTRTPLRQAMFRHTRALLRRYQEAGLLPEGTRIPTRLVQDRFVELDKVKERPIYDRIERHLQELHQAASKRAKDVAVQYRFLLGIYQQRLTSSPWAIQRSLARRAERLRTELGLTPLTGAPVRRDSSEELIAPEEGIADSPDSFRVDEEPVDPSLARLELDSLETFLEEMDLRLTDSKFERLRQDLGSAFRGAHHKVMIFTQFTDTLDYLRQRLVETFGCSSEIACYSGRGGELPAGSKWIATSKENIKERFRTGAVRYLVCTDAASEGLNFQTCGLLINFDLPWNPMRVEQRIGRIDRIGQERDEVVVFNYGYHGTVEAEIYGRLRERFGLFETVVGRAQPILSTLDARIEQLAFSRVRADEIDALVSQIEEPGPTSHVPIDPDEHAPLPTAPTPVSAVMPEDLERLALSAPVFRGDLEPAGVEGAFRLAWNRLPKAVTFRPRVADQHPDTLELLTYGHPRFEELLAAVRGQGTAPGGSGLLRVEGEAEELRVVRWTRSTETGHGPVTSVGELEAAATDGIDETQESAATRDRVLDQSRHRYDMESRLERTLRSARATRAAGLVARLLVLDHALAYPDDEDGLSGTLGEIHVRDPRRFDRAPLPQLAEVLDGAGSAAWHALRVDGLADEVVGGRRPEALRARRMATAREAEAWLATLLPLAFTPHTTVAGDAVHLTISRHGR